MSEDGNGAAGQKKPLPTIYPDYSMPSVIVKRTPTRETVK